MFLAMLSALADAYSIIHISFLDCQIAKCFERASYHAEKSKYTETKFQSQEKL